MRNTQPDGGEAGLGNSPDNTAVRGCVRALIDGRRGDQRPRVGMSRRAEDVRGRSLLDDAAEIHHDDALAQMPHHMQVVADEQQREAERGTQLGHQRR